MMGGFSQTAIRLSLNDW